MGGVVPRLAQDSWHGANALEETTSQREAPRPEVVLVEQRLIRRVIKQHLLEQGHATPGVVPHCRCYGLARELLQQLIPREELPLSTNSPADEVVLVSRPLGESASERRLAARQTRRAFLHGRVHLLLEASRRRGELDDATVRSRTHQLGRTEFEEIRTILGRDDLLLPPGNDFQVYVEFAAVYLELHRYAPELLLTTFPGLEDHDEVLRVLSQDLALDVLLDEPSDDSRGRSIASPDRRAPQDGRASREDAGWRRALSAKAARRRLRRAQQQRQKNQDDHALVSCALATTAADQEVQDQARSELAQDAERMAHRLAAALDHSPGERDARWERSIERLALAAARHPRPSSTPERGVLRALHQAALSFEKPGFVVDVPSWILSWGKHPALSPRETAHRLAVARYVDRAIEQSSSVRLRKADRGALFHFLEEARHGAQRQVRVTLGRKIANALRRVGLRPRSGPEAQARDHLVEEMLDQVLERGFSSLSQLRDGISRHELKLPDLSSRSDLLRGDPLLQADEHLSKQLDGIHRRGDVYLRWLQKLSSLAFGTRAGRYASLWFLLPVLGAFTIVEGVRLILGPVAGWFGAAPWRFSWIAFAATALAILGLLHSERSRIALRLLLDAVGWVSGLLFLRLPRALLGGVFFQRLLRRPGFRAFIRMVLVPTSISLLTFLVTPAAATTPILRWAVTLTTFLVVAVVMGSRLGYWLEDFYLEQIAPAWGALSRQWIPSLLRAINRTFSAATDAMENVSHKIGETLRFRPTDSMPGLVLAGGAGLLWAMIAYVVRLYVTLLVEPEVNPLKHFPVVTVAHKLMLPFLPDLLTAIERPLAILGPVFGGALAAVTVFLLPSIFGFLAWELKANYRLYRATRSRYVDVVRFGPQGETCRELLVEGLHSGTIPKLYARTRRAAERRLEARTRAGPDGQPLTSSPDVARFQTKLQGVERSLRRLVERELLPALRAADDPALALELRQVDISSNRLRIRLTGDVPSVHQRLEISIEQLGGRLVASLSRNDLVAELSETQRVVLENALAVFYHRAQIDLVREQLEAELKAVATPTTSASNPEDHWDYDVQEQGLLVQLQGQTILYPLDTHFRKQLAPKLRSEHRGTAPRFASTSILYKEQRIEFEEWERAWDIARDSERRPPRLVPSASLLGLPPS